MDNIRFGVRATSVPDVNMVGTDLIITRRVIFTTNSDIKEELRKTNINITCYDCNGDLVKRVTFSDDGDIEDSENEEARMRKFLSVEVATRLVIRAMTSPRRSR